MATTFAGLWDELKADAAAEWKKLEADGVQLEQKIIPVLESDLALIGTQIKNVLISTATNMMTTEFAALTSNEKQGNVVTAGIQAAEAQGKSLAVEDATMFAQQAFRALGVTLPAA